MTACIDQTPTFADMLTQHKPLIRIILAKMRSRLPREIDWEELSSIGLMGLIDAIRKFDPSKGYAFETYASFRVRGAIQDGLRKLDALSRLSRTRHKKLEAAKNELEQALGRMPTSKELQEKVGLTQAEFERIERRAHPVEFIHLDAPSKLDPTLTAAETIASDVPHSAAILETKELRADMLAAVEDLPYRYRKIIHLCYFEGWKLAEVSKELGLTQARISQLRAEALKLLKAHLA